MNMRYRALSTRSCPPGCGVIRSTSSQGPEYNGALRDRGTFCRVIFDRTVPFELKDRFKRSAFLEVDPSIGLLRYSVDRTPWCPSRCTPGGGTAPVDPPP